MTREEGLLLGIKVDDTGAPRQLQTIAKADADFLIDCFEVGQHDDGPIYLLNLLPTRTLQWLVDEHRKLEAIDQARTECTGHG